MRFPKRDRIPLTKSSGVYAISNKVNGKTYVGSALSLRGRMLTHRSCLRRGTHDNTHLQRSWNRYGENSFRFDVLQTCSPDRLILCEQKWIDFLDSAVRKHGYNLCPTAGSLLGHRHSEETRALYRKQRKGTVPVAATRAAAIANRGKKRSPEIGAKISASQKGRKYSPETLANMKAGHWRNKPGWEEIVERSAAKQRGKKLSMETKKRIGQSHWKNRPDAEEIAAKVSESLRRANAIRRGIAHGTTA